MIRPRSNHVPRTHAKQPSSVCDAVEAEQNLQPQLTFTDERGRRTYSALPILIFRKRPKVRPTSQSGVEREALTEVHTNRLALQNRQCLLFAADMKTQRRSLLSDRVFSALPSCSLRPHVRQSTTAATHGYSQPPFHVNSVLFKVIQSVKSYRGSHRS